MRLQLLVIFALVASSCLTGCDDGRARIPIDAYRGSRLGYPLPDDLVVSNAESVGTVGDWYISDDMAEAGYIKEVQKRPRTFAGVELKREFLLLTPGDFADCKNEVSRRKDFARKYGSYVAHDFLVGSYFETVSGRGDELLSALWHSLGRPYVSRSLAGNYYSFTWKWSPRSSFVARLLDPFDPDEAMVNLRCTGETETSTCAGVVANNHDWTLWERCYFKLTQGATRTTKVKADLSRSID